MALYGISDLHLSFNEDKPMDVFGAKWDDYEKRLEKNWNNLVTDEDVVIINGDVSWAMYLEDTYDDFNYINKLNGKKIILKGNHDYWWTTMNKHLSWCAQNDFDSISFVQNNCYIYKETAVCGSRGWQLTTSDEEDKKIYNRELERLKLSFEDAKKQGVKNIITALHYPPDEAFKKLMEEYGVLKCIFGHLHGNGYKDYEDFTENGISYNLVSCDYLGFNPYKILD